ncbi:MAG: hypothetical protein ABSA23_11180, partial [Anaerolineales bacterium]
MFDMVFYPNLYSGNTLTGWCVFRLVNPNPDEPEEERERGKVAQRVGPEGTLQVMAGLARRLPRLEI